jgi:hypothetical protein
MLTFYFQHLLNNSKQDINRVLAYYNYLGVKKKYAIFKLKKQIYISRLRIKKSKTVFFQTSEIKTIKIIKKELAQKNIKMQTQSLQSKLIPFQFHL